MRKRNLAHAILVAALATMLTGCPMTQGPDTVRVVPLGPSAGVQFAQVDFTWTLNPHHDSATGQLSLDVAAVRDATELQECFVNVITAAGWVLRNVPIFADFPYADVSTKFPLDVDQGTDVNELSAEVSCTSEPVQQAPSVAPVTFPVVATVMNAGGFGPHPTQLPPPPTTLEWTFPAGAETFQCLQTGHENVEAADQQCGPAAVANSLQWLGDATGIDIPDAHEPGLSGDGTLVGELDEDMGRLAETRRNGNGVGAEAIVEGKLEYLQTAGLADDVEVKHQHDGSTTGSEPGGDDYDAHGHTSTGHGAPSAEFIIDELCDGEDVEFAYIRPDGSGHAVTAVKAGRLFGMPYVYYVSDHDQSDDSSGTEHVDFSWIDDTDDDGAPELVGDEGGAEIVLVTTESPVEP